MGEGALAGDVFRIELPAEASGRPAAGGAASPRGIDEVVETSADTRSLAEAILLVQVVGGVLSDLGGAVSLVESVIGLIRRKKVIGATSELPDGTKIEVDHASADEIERLVAAATGRR